MCRNSPTETDFSGFFSGLFLWAFAPQNRRPFLGLIFGLVTRQEKVVVNHRKSS